MFSHIIGYMIATISMCKLNMHKIMLIHSMAIVKDFMLLSILQIQIATETRHLWCVVSPPIIHKTMHFMHNNYYGIIIIILKF